MGLGNMPVVPALYFLFPAGNRPDQNELRDIISEISELSISHDPTGGGGSEVNGDGDGDGEGWLEILLDGLTYDLAGLAPSSMLDIPEFRYHFDLARGDIAPSVEILKLTCGPHLESGARQPPIMRSQLRLALLLAQRMDSLSGIGWSPAASVMSSDYFARILDSWLNRGGPFPGLGLIGFQATDNGALLSEGMAVWCDQELRIEGRLAQDRTDATRLAVRLVNQLVAMGGLQQAETLTGPDGAMLSLTPSPDGQLLWVREG